MHTDTDTDAQTHRHTQTHTQTDTHTCCFSHKQPMKARGCEGLYRGVCSSGILGLLIHPAHGGGPPRCDALLEPQPDFLVGALYRVRPVDDVPVSSEVR